MGILILFVFILFGIFEIDAQTTKSSETTSAIVQKLLHNHDKNQSPRPGIGTEVKIGVYVMSLNSINEQNMDYSVSMYLRQSWNDPRLAFDKLANETVKTIRLMDNSWDKIWIPDTFMRNEKQASFHYATVNNRMMRLSRDGSVWYVIKISAILSCPMNLARFPMDTQVCAITFESFSYTMNDVYYSVMPPPIQIDTNLQLPQFMLTDTSHHNCSQNYTTGAYPCLEYKFVLRRDLGYFILQIYLPTFLMVFLSWLSFCLNSEATTARMIIGFFTIMITTLISSGAKSSLPRVSYLTAMDIWNFVCIFFIFLSIVQSAVISYLGKPDKSQGKDQSPSAESKKQKISRMMDQLSRIIFPVVFILFNIIYWSVYSC